MSLSTQEAIYEEFRAATREHLMKKITHPGDWDRFHEIQDTARSRVDQELQDWQQSYHSRLAEARQIILREVHGNVLEPPKPQGVETIPDRQALDVMADQRIRRDHELRLAAIKQDELDQFQDLKKLIKDRGAVKDLAKRDFEKVRNPVRSGPSRG